VNRTCGGNFSDTFSHTTHHRLITEQCHQNCFEVNRNCGGNFSDTFFSHHRSYKTGQCHQDYNGENSKDRKDAQCRETEQCHQLRAKAKKILLTVAKDLSSRQDKSFSQKDESQ